MKQISKLTIRRETIKQLETGALLRVRGGQPVFTEEEVSCDSRAEHCTGLCPPYSYGGTCYFTVCGA